MAAYYNEFEPFAAAWLRELIKEGVIADGEVDTRSIAEVTGDDLAGFTQCHFFAGIGGWSHALRLAGWPDARPVWTGSCPCQPFSLAGDRRGFDDARHLWPQFRRLIAERRPAIVFGEQVASATDWLGIVRSDLEALAYAVGAMPIEAASAGADHLRDRYWFVAHGEGERQHGIEDSARPSRGPGAEADGVADTHQPSASEERQQRGGQQCGPGSDQEPRSMGDVASIGRGEGRPEHEVQCGRDAPASPSGALDWVIGADGKARRVKPGVRLLAHGIPGRVGKLRGFGNAIDPRPAAAFIQAAAEAVAAT